MQITVGFIIVLVFIVFPGLIFRRLYFFGEFSKQFQSGFNLVKLLSVSSIPGIINLILIFLFYDAFVSQVDLGAIIDKIKDLNNPDFRFQKSDDLPLKDLINIKIAPFVGFLYVAVTIIGISTGRLIRGIGLDTKFKILKYNNYWFYLFSGQSSNFKKMKYLAKNKMTHVFTSADILVDAENGAQLYSGIIVDYELSPTDCGTLSKVMLREAKRYSKKDNTTNGVVSIPGELFVLDCSSMKNINLTYAYVKSKELLSSWVPVLVERIFAFLFLFLIPMAVFQFEAIDFDFYKGYFTLKYTTRFFIYLAIVQVLGICFPFVNLGNGKYKWASWKEKSSKIVFFFLFLALALIIG